MTFLGLNQPPIFYIATTRLMMNKLCVHFVYKAKIVSLRALCQQIFDAKELCEGFWMVWILTSHVPNSKKFSRAKIFTNRQQTLQEKFATFIFATRSRCLTTPPTISSKGVVILSVYFNVKTIARCYHAYQSV